MGIKYQLDPEIQEEVNEIARTLFPHVKIDSVVCIRSHGSGSRGTIARCHALGKAMQLALGRKGFYVIEVISKRYDRLPREEKTKTLIHELMHIPKTFGGGFIHHDVVHERNVQRMYDHYINLKRGKEENGFGVEILQKKEPVYEKIEIDFSNNNQNNQRIQNIQKDMSDFLIIKRKKKRFWF